MQLFLARNHAHIEVVESAEGDLGHEIQLVVEQLGAFKALDHFAEEFRDLQLAQQMADAAAVTATQEGQVQQQQKANQEDVLIGQQKAGLAANGIDVGSGTAVDLLADTKAAGEFDQLTITNNAARTAQGFENQGINYQNQAVVNEQESAAALQGGELKADSALITGAGSVANSWYNYTNGSSSFGLSTPFSSSPQAGAII